jgi:hypothetical protein
MKTVIYRYIAFAILTIFSLGSYSFAENVDKTDTANSGKKDGGSLPVIKIKVDNQASSNPNLKKGKGCEDLEEAKGEVIVDIPDAETIPCDKANGCNDLKPANLKPYQYKDIPTVQTDGSCEGDD